MKLASLNSGGRDGELIVVDRALQNAVRVPAIARTLQAALDDWQRLAPELESVYADLLGGRLDGAFPFDPCACAAPLPRAYHWTAALT